MTKKEQPKQKQVRGALSKGGLVQFRADEGLLADLSQVAERLHIPVGVLARQWVSERVQRELAFDIASLQEWRKARNVAIDLNIDKLFEKGPVQILHVLPYQRNLEISPDAMSQVHSLMPPVERASEYDGRINLFGYETHKQFKTRDKWAGYVQFFTSGQLESVRELAEDENRCIYADRMEEDIIHSFWTYCSALDAMGISLPIALFLSFKGMSGYKLKSPRFSGPSKEISFNEFTFTPITVKDWNEVLKIENAAQTVKRFLDRLANSAGLPRSFSYSVSGDWLGPTERTAIISQKIRLSPRTEVIELSGINRDEQREDLILHNVGKAFVLGKVRKPYLEPTSETKFKCFVHQDEMEAGAKPRLETMLRQKTTGDFRVGSIKFAGVITRITEGLAGGAYDGTTVPQEPILFFEISPERT